MDRFIDPPVAGCDIYLTSDLAIFLGLKVVDVALAATVTKLETFSFFRIIKISLLSPTAWSFKHRHLINRLDVIFSYGNQVT